MCDNLNISPSTLKTHIRNIHRRLGISSRHELAWLVTANPAGISETQGGGR
ncbi:LuxR C-terminal-related transcriptional regulator [Bilophila wadsworthia]|uniref:LuxR C-terminal-related transcriptional regulator n=1 Tax=Bilophila wadsworthia TaxID=35833 RepID=UPI003C6C5D1D